MVRRGVAGVWGTLAILTGLNTAAHLIGLLVLFIWGLIVVVTASPVHAVPVTGIVSDVAQRYEGGSYVRTDFWLEKDQRTFATDVRYLQPPIFGNRPANGSAVTVWVNPGIDWFQISRTDIVAMSIAPEPLRKAAHAEWGFSHPNEQATRERLIGAGFLAIVALILGLGQAWDWLETGRRPSSPRTGS